MQSLRIWTRWHIMRVMSLGIFLLADAVSAGILYDNIDPPWDKHGPENVIGPRPDSSIDDRYFAQEFSSGGASAITIAEVLLQQVGAPSGDIHFDIFDEVNGRPNSSIGRLGSVDLATLSSEANVVTLEGDISIEPDESYFLVADMVDTDIRSRNNSFRLGMRVAADGTNGVSRALVSLPGQVDNFATLGNFLPGSNFLTMRLTGEMEPILGDFNQNGLLDAADIDQLSQQIAAESPLAVFDLNSDGEISVVDREFWISELAGTLVGDADLNGHVAFPDFLAVSANFGMNGGWAEGDFDGNGEVTFPDFLLLSENFGNVAIQASAVPEPNYSCSYLLVAFGMIRQRLRRLLPD